MVPIGISRKLVLSGSDELVRALYERVRTDAGFGPGAAALPARSWSELADLAVAEHTLTRAEARCLAGAKAAGHGPKGTHVPGAGQGRPRGPRPLGHAPQVLSAGPTRA